MQQGPDPDFWDIATPEREPVQSRWFLGGVVLSVLISTPWYLPAAVAGRQWLGLPVWVWCALFGGVTLACCTSWAALHVWRDSDVQPLSDEQKGR